jgi:hypothetical protein
MPDEDLIRAEWVSVRASGRRSGHPPAVSRLHEIAYCHHYPWSTAAAARAGSSERSETYAAAISPLEDGLLVRGPPKVVV